MPQPRQRLLLDLAHPLARDPEQRADLFERHRLLALEAEIESQDLRLALFEGRENALDRFCEGVLEDLVVGTGILGVGEIVEQLVVFARGEWCVEREMRL